MIIRNAIMGAKGLKAMVRPEHLLLCDWMNVNGSAMQLLSLARQ